MDVDRYLSRISYKGSREPNLKLLTALQEQHLMHVPFENLDIHSKTPIELDVSRIFEKVVNYNRGGFCYELNGLFYELLRLLGFNVKMVSARVYNTDKKTISQEFDHLAIIAKIDLVDYLVDVGFGEFSFLPLEVKMGPVQHDQRGDFRIEKYDDVYYQVQKACRWNLDNRVCIFNAIKRSHEFKEMCLISSNFSGVALYSKQDVLAGYGKRQNNSKK
jgi:N-hydroxyarylamine O-acetyltransferase